MTVRYRQYALERTPIFEMAKKEKFDGPLPTVCSGTRCQFLCNCEIVVYDLNVFRRNRVYDLNSWSAREKAVAIEREMGRERERREER